jgi:hypothetical protein
VKRLAVACLRVAGPGTTMSAPSYRSGQPGCART